MTRRGGIKGGGEFVLYVMTNCTKAILWWSDISFP